MAVSFNRLSCGRSLRYGDADGADAGDREANDGGKKFAAGIG